MLRVNIHIIRYSTNIYLKSWGIRFNSIASLRLCHTPVEFAIKYDEVINDLVRNFFL